ncbi:MAG: M3 family oligoendopeptidase [Armatimonadota bacterium]
MATGALPHWDMTPIFPGLDSPELAAALERAREDVADLGRLFDRHQVRGTDDGAVTPEIAAAFDEVTGRLNARLQENRVLGAYLNCFVSIDAADDRAQSLLSELRALSVPLNQLGTRYTAWAGTLDTDALLQASQTARDHEHAVRRAGYLARHQMPEGEEALAAELQPAGLNGWARLHNDVTSLLTVTLTLRGEEQTLPMSSVRALANDPDRSVRQGAYEAELRAWDEVTVPLAAALNGIKGFQRSLRARRGYGDDVEPTLIVNGIDREILEAMQAACVESFPDFRRYMGAKARALGVERLAWFDLHAPLGTASREYTWDDAEAFIREQFGRYSERLAGFADRSFRERWIDAEPRPGKEGGAYCTGLRPGESRVLMNYDNSFNSVSTLAHELGHAYHNLNLAERTPLQRQTPMTLAETASIFCETLAFEAALKDAGPEERLGLLETSLQRDLMVVVDIHSRFLFEKGVFERRGRRELTAAEFSELMLETQAQTYGDGLEPERRHPYMWAVKGHYYGPTFYNYPYTFGLLFGLGLYARYQGDPDGFRQGYDDLLSSTGLADAATLAQRFGIDVRSIDFWRSSLDVIRGNISEFEKLVG